MRYILSWIVYKFSHILSYIGDKFLWWSTLALHKSSKIQSTGKGPWAR